MNRFEKTLLGLVVAGAASCATYASDPYQGSPGAPPDDRSQSSSPDNRYGDNRYDDESRSPDWEVGFFYQELSPFGDWIYTYEYGWTWLPRQVPFGWRPYSIGRWVPSEYGWYWASYEPFGWATYHYGRWAWHPRFGWIWAPGRTWGPAWVAWQEGRGYLGWAPLPPEIGFEIGIGLRLGGLDLNLIIRPHAYTFVDERRFLEPELNRWALPSARNVTIIHNTTNITNYTIVQNRVVNRGVDVVRVERVTGRKLKTLRIAETESTASRKRDTVRTDEVVVYKPSKQRLETVRVDEGKPHRGRGDEKSSKEERGTRDERPDTNRGREVEVAPRVKAEPPAASQRIEKKEQKEEKELAAYERSERQKLDELQRSERDKPSPQADADATAKRHAEEKKALDEELKRSKQQLEGRQEVERQAVKAHPRGQQTSDQMKSDQKTADQKAADQNAADQKKADEKKAQDKKAQEKKAQEKKDAAHGKKKPHSDDAPPPHH